MKSHKSRSTNSIGELLNLGPKSSAWLAAVGVRTRADLERVGSLRAYQMAKAAGFNVSLNLLYALEGALRGERWDELPDDVKLRLEMQANFKDDLAVSERRRQKPRQNDAREIQKFPKLEGRALSRLPLRGTVTTERDPPTRSASIF